MRALLGGVIGAAVSAAAWLGIEHLQQANYSWLVVLVGLVTGICVNKAGAGTTSGFARGALALILTLAGVVGGHKGYAKFMEATTSTEAVASAAAFETGEDGDAEEEAPEAESASTPIPVVETAPVAFDKSNYSKTALKKNFGEWEMIWMCVAALAAYVTGKGSDKTSVVVDDQGEKEAAEESEQSDA